MTVYITETKVYEIDMEEYIEWFNEYNDDETINYYASGSLIQDYIFTNDLDFSDGDESEINFEADKEEDKLFDKYIKNPNKYVKNAIRRNKLKKLEVNN